MIRSSKNDFYRNMQDGTKAGDIYEKNGGDNKDELETDNIHPLVSRRKLLIKKQF